jgi:hypothetical protein
LEAGRRHVVVTGAGLGAGQIMTRGELHNALQSGRIVVRGATL